MDLSEIEPHFRRMLEEAYTAAGGAAEMTPEEAQKLEAQVAEALPVVWSSEPDTYPDDLPHRIARGLVAVVSGMMHKIDFERETATWEG